MYGPAIPSETDVSQFSRDEEDDDNILGPKRPTNELTTSVVSKEEEEDDFHKNLYHPRVKPSISTTSTAVSKEKEEKKRDEWMTELPNDRNSFAQLVPRTFSKSGKSFKVLFTQCS